MGESSLHKRLTRDQSSDDYKRLRNQDRSRSEECGRQNNQREVSQREDPNWISRNVRNTDCPGETLRVEAAVTALEDSTLRPRMLIDRARATTRGQQRSRP